MTNKGNSLLVLGSAPDLTATLREVLQPSGWRIDQQANAVCGLEDLCQQHQVIILCSGENSLSAIRDMLRSCSDADAAAVLPVLENPTPEEVISVIRLGASDVLLRPFNNDELVQTVARVARHRNIYQQNRKYSSQMEKMNKELRESLNILKMDQIAGRQVQKSLLPTSPLVCNGYTVTHKIIPSLYLSGDFVSYNVVFDRYILFYIADVSGHGASSAFVTILLRFILKRILRRHARNNDVTALARAPEGFIEHVNRQILATGLEKQITMFAGALDTEKHMLRYSVAAQMPMPVFVVNQDARTLPGKGKVIGLFEDARWSVEELFLPQDFRLVMVSDGLLETLPGTTLEAKENYLIDTLANAPADHDTICKALELDKITEAADDVSLLSIVRGGS